MRKRGKKYQEVAKLVDEEKRYVPEEALDLAKQTSYVNFDASVEIHLRMGADPKHADQQVRGVALLPHGLGKEVRVLGRRGLMPNPRSGTVVQGADLRRAIDEVRKGRVEFRLDRSGVIHSVVGKVSFDTQKLKENLATLMEAIMAARPSTIKGQFVRTVALTTAMGPSIRLDVPAVIGMKVE